MTIKQAFLLIVLFFGVIGVGLIIENDLGYAFFLYTPLACGFTALAASIMARLEYAKDEAREKSAVNVGGDGI